MRANCLGSSSRSSSARPVGQHRTTVRSGQGFRVIVSNEILIGVAGKMYSSHLSGRRSGAAHTRVRSHWISRRVVESWWVLIVTTAMAR